MNNYFSVRFFCENSSNQTQITFHYNEEKNCYYNAIIKNDDESVFYAINVKSGFWNSFNFGKPFRYNINLLKFDGDVIKFIFNDNFDVKDHNFNITLKSDDEKQIKIWKYYLWLLQLKLNVKFNVIVNEEFDKNDTDDFVEISIPVYINLLKKSDKPIIDDYSSLTIISSILDIIEDKDKLELFNHPWLK